MKETLRGIRHDRTIPTTPRASRCTRAEPETPGEGTLQGGMREGSEEEVHDGMREGSDATPNFVLGRRRNTDRSVGEGGEAPVRENPRGIHHVGTNPVLRS